MNGFDFPFLHGSNKGPTAEEQRYGMKRRNSSGGCRLVASEDIDAGAIPSAALDSRSAESPIRRRRLIPGTGRFGNHMAKSRAAASVAASQTEPSTMATDTGAVIGVTSSTGWLQCLIPTYL